MWDTRQSQSLLYVASHAPNEHAIISDRKIPLSTKMSFLAFPMISYTPGKIQP